LAFFCGGDVIFGAVQAEDLVRLSTRHNLIVVASGRGSLAERIWAYARPITEWSNFMLQPPPPHVISLLVAASQNQTIADAYADGFANPLPTWELLRDPERVAALLDAK
jgi:hypothetical protein